jgi:hypothetical protein
MASRLSALTARLYDRWADLLVGNGYWWSYGVCRVSIGLALLRMFRNVDMDYANFFACQVPEHYRPLGLLYLFGKGVPDPALFNVFREIARVSMWLVVIGFFSRVNLLVSTVLLCLLTGALWAFTGTWCHGFNPVLLTAIAMLLGPPCPLSVDGALRKLFGKPVPAPEVRRARGPVLLGQFAVAMVFASAGLFKLVLGNGEPFAWCYSDSMRNILLLQYWALNEPVPDWVRFAVTHTWAYKGMAVGNIMTQLTPSLACLFFRRPLVRLLGGAAFLTEAVCIGTIMGLWNPHWFPLVAFFIDWDRLIGLATGQITPQPRYAGATFAGPDPAGRAARLWRARAYAGYALLFAGFYLVVAFTHPTPRHFTYPFTSFPMYSTVYADAPYRDHRPFHLIGSQWEIDADPPVSQQELDRVWVTFRADIWYTDPPELAKAVRAHLEASGHKVRGLTIHKTVFDIPAFPDWQVHPGASALGYLDQGGRARWNQFKIDRERDAGGRVSVRVHGNGFSDPRYRFGAYQNLSGSASALAGEWVADRFYFREPSADPFYLVVWVRDESLGPDEVLFGCEFVTPPRNGTAAGR